VRRANVRDLHPAQFRVVASIAHRLAEAGFPSWIVGGATRDLARGVCPKDVDMVTPATPDQVEGLFEHTVSVGRAFGIVVVVLEGVNIEVATLRTERGYSDGRRPEEVRFGTSVEEDAARRDFTCNALYLDPLTDETLDPTGGLSDLDAGVLSTVGDAWQRFAEDGLRLLRLARFQAALDAAPAPDLLEAAAGSLDALRGVSPERVLQELSRILDGPRVPLAFRTLFDTGVLAAAMPLWAARNRATPGLRLAALAHLPAPPGQVLGLAWLLESTPEAPEGDLVGDLEVADTLRPSRDLRRSLERAWTVRRGLPVAAGGATRSRLLRDPGWRPGCELALAWTLARGLDAATLEAQRAWRAQAKESELFPPQLVKAAELLDRGVPRGPQLGSLLRDLEDAQLDGEITSRDDALDWLARREDTP
jgi:tRNA nucleotidyltransferase/poly(A) polymerase